MRISKKDLEITLKNVNSILEENGLKSSYAINRAYGYYRLVQYEGSGCRDISSPMTLKEIYLTISAIEKLLINSIK